MKKVLVIKGKQGSGKTRLAEFLRSNGYAGKILETNDPDANGEGYILELNSFGVVSGGKNG